MRHSLFILCLVALILPVGCGTRDRLAPESGPSAVLVEDTIGIAGGVLAADEVRLSVPAGALLTDTHLAIYEFTDPHPFADLNRPAYSVVGLPQELHAPVTLRFMHGADGKDAITFYRGENRDGRSGGRQLAWEPIACSDSSGWCIAQLTRGPFDFGDKRTEQQVYLSGEEMKRLEPSAHFELGYCESDISREGAQTVLEMMELSFDHLRDLGFAFGGNDAIWPLPAYMIQPEKSLCAYFYGVDGKGYFMFTPDITPDSDFMRAIVCHEVFHCGQQWYDPRPSQDWISGNAERLWLDEAASSWIELDVISGGYTSPFSIGGENIAMPLAGLCGHPSLTDDMYGYGMASFIEYVVRQQGRSVVQGIYQGFLTEGSIVGALRQVLVPPIAEWCLEFHHKIALSEIYSIADWHVLYHSYDFNIEDIYRTLGKKYGYVRQIADFGSAVVSLSVFEESTNEADALRLRAPEHMHLTAYVASEWEEAQVIASGRDSLTLVDLDRVTCHHMQDDFRRLVVLMTKDWADGWNWDNRSDVTLEVEMLRPAEYEHLTRCIVNGLIQAYVIGEGLERQGFWVASYEAADGTWTDNEYTLAWDTTAGIARHSGSIHLRINPVTLDVEHFTGTQFYYQSDIDYTKTEEFEGKGVPLITNDGGELILRLEGAAVCDSLITAYRRRVEAGSVTEEWDADAFGCIGGGEQMSYLEIRLWDPTYKAEWDGAPASRIQAGSTGGASISTDSTSVVTPRPRHP
ncbi:MAG: hypothetical protein KJ970_18180 [Candidatus Eisenbacteria bacterium]|uniref:Uncharacterized protein n=1 Tax=Eiseniibacteriota bacterium TaxID=2212470 RepID=A0A948RZK0_UNCEI|nr:hypothetical protein [Candidatus Eisenbacteria bacterium]MBU1949929.1 hypothetical protein [Candidatus Eisenbacteria bacterium]MBU2692851.1 hypothetical protein [Candidatus Eisenbacteria bacterium]